MSRAFSAIIEQGPAAARASQKSESLFQSEMNRHMLEKIESFEKKYSKLERNYNSLAEKHEKMAEAFRKNLQYSLSLCKKLDKKDKEIKELSKLLIGKTERIGRRKTSNKEDRRDSSYKGENIDKLDRSDRALLPASLWDSAKESRKASLLTQKLDEMSQFYRDTIPLAKPRVITIEDQRHSDQIRNSRARISEGVNSPGGELESKWETPATAKATFESQKMQLRNQLEELDIEIDQIKARNAKRLIAE